MPTSSNCELLGLNFNRFGTGKHLASEMSQTLRLEMAKEA